MHCNIQSIIILPLYNYSPIEESIDTTNELFKSNKRLLGAVDVTDRLQDSLVLVGVAVVVVDVVADFGFDVAVAVAVAASSAVDDDYDCDCDDDSVAFSTYRIFACKGHVPVESVLARFSHAGVHSASSD